MKTKKQNRVYFHLLTASVFIESISLSFATSGTEKIRPTVTTKVRLTLRVYLFRNAVPDPLEHCRQYRLTEAFSTCSFFSALKARKNSAEKTRTKSVLCLLSDAPVRPLDGFTAALVSSLSNFFSRVGSFCYLVSARAALAQKLKNRTS